MKRTAEPRANNEDDQEDCEKEVILTIISSAGNKKVPSMRAN
jgi:hypothetical protein